MPEPFDTDAAGLKVLADDLIDDETDAVTPRAAHFQAIANAIESYFQFANAPVRAGET